MRPVACIVLALAAFVAPACQETEDRTLDGAFSLAGRVLRTQGGLQSEKIEAGTEDDKRPGADGGSFDVEVRNRNALSQDLRPCDVSGVFKILFTSSTRFDPADIVDAGDFPRNLRGATVDVDGMLERDEEADIATQACRLVADRVTVEEGGEGSPAPTGTAEPSPGLPQQG